MNAYFSFFFCSKSSEMYTNIISNNSDEKIVATLFLKLYNKTYFNKEKSNILFTFFLHSFQSILYFLGQKKRTFPLNDKQVPPAPHYRPRSLYPGPHGLAPSPPS